MPISTELINLDRCVVKQSTQLVIIELNQFQSEIDRQESDLRSQLRSKLHFQRK
jgi:hypothetical protein